MIANFGAIEGDFSPWNWSFLLKVVRVHVSFLMANF